MPNETRTNLITTAGSSALRPTPIAEYRGHVRDVVKRAITRAEESLAGSFHGITIGEQSHDAVAPIAATGVSVESIINSAQSFLHSLSSSERELVCFDVDDDYSWRSWHNMHFFLMRHGLPLFDMTVDQRGKALDLLRTTMSVSGYDNARDVMRLNGHAAELTGRHDEYGEHYYWISIFGRPSTTEPWGWQIDGHHLIVNCFVLGDQVVMTPDFRGSEPVEATSGEFSGTKVFADEEAQGLKLMQSFDAAQRAVATISDVPPREVITTAQVDNLVLDADGVAFAQLTSAQQDHSSI